MSQTKEGRQKIAAVTNIAGIRKVLATSQKGKSGNGKKVVTSNPSDVILGPLTLAKNAERGSSYARTFFPQFSRPLITDAEKQAALDKMTAENPAWGGPLNQFGMPASARQQRLDMVQNYNELNADAPGWASRGPTGKDIKNWLSRNLKFWD